MTRIPLEKLNTVESKVVQLFDCASIERGETGILFKKAKLAAYLRPVSFERENLLRAARALYRVILEEEVTVEIRSA